MLNLPGMYAGLQVFESPHALSVRKVDIEKSWVQRVIEWNPCNPREPDYKEIFEPTSFVAGNKLICHPSIVVKLSSFA